MERIRLSGGGKTRTYTPDADFFGQDSFTFNVNDGRADSSLATVTIDVAPVDDASRMREARLRRLRTPTE